MKGTFSIEVDKSKLKLEIEGEELVQLLTDMILSRLGKQLGNANKNLPTG